MRKRKNSLGHIFYRVSKSSIAIQIDVIEQSFINSKIPSVQLNYLRFLLSKVISINNRPLKSNLSPPQISGLFKLISAPNLINTKTDKSDQIVLLNSSDYLSNVDAMLSSGPNTILSKKLSTDHLKNVKRNAKNSIQFCLATK